MGFQLLVKHRATDTAAPCAMRTGRGRVFMSFSASCLSQIGWKAGDKVEVFVGDGADLGTLKLKPGARGYALRPKSPTSTRLKIEFSRWRGLPEKHAALDAELTPRGNGEITVRIPFERELAKPARVA